jgi:putative oxidoreductase
MTKKLYLSFRVLTSLIFITAGIGHLVNPDKVLARLHRSTIYEWLPLPNLFVGLVVVSGVVMLASGICLVANFKVKLAAIALLATLIPITLSVQLENLNDLGPFFKNVAITGSLIVLIKIKKHEIH